MTMNALTTVEPELTLSPQPRLAPRRLRGILPRLLDRYMRWQFGKSMSPIAVLYARIPGMTFGQMALERFSQRGLHLDADLRHRIEQRVCRNNACDFCADLTAAVALHEGQRLELLESATASLGAAGFDGPTVAALRYVDELCAHKTVTAETFAALLEHFDEVQVSEIVWLSAWTSYHNLLARPLGLASEGFCELVQSRR